MPPPIFLSSHMRVVPEGYALAIALLSTLLNAMCKIEQRALLRDAKVACETARRSDIGRLPGLGRAVSLPSLSHLPHSLNWLPLQGKLTWLATSNVVAREHVQRSATATSRSILIPENSNPEEAVPGHSERRFGIRGDLQEIRK